MQHFLQISDLSRQQVEALIERALFFKQTGQFPSYQNRAVANLFYENSTRTRVSFELAAKNMQISVINLDLQTSSEQKGEVIEDTIKTIAAMGISSVVIRHKQDGLPQLLAERCLNDSLHIINAGDGQHAHPSQAMLDMMTIVASKPKLDQLKIAVVGDVRHSRVVHSLQALCALMGIGELVMVAPELWQPDVISFGRVTTSLKEGLEDADVVMCLRVQRERLLETEQLDLEHYRAHYAITPKTLSYARSDALLMHPGPMNRGVEIDSEVADGAQSVILKQVQHGVFMRMAILELFC